jgi:hypothetical protein
MAYAAELSISAASEILITKMYLDDRLPMVKAASNPLQAGHLQLFSILLLNLLLSNTFKYE